MGASLLVLSNKTDVGNCMSNEEICDVRPTTRFRTGWLRLMFAQQLQLDAIKTHRWTIIGCSAIAGSNLDKGLEWVVQDARDRLFLY